MKKKEPIKNRKNDKPTRYYPAGKMIKIHGVGEFASLIQEMWDDEDSVQQTFKLAAVTAEFVYYADGEESDESASVVMLNRGMKLVSDNYFAFSDLFELVEKNEGLLWMSKALKYGQRQQFVKPAKITAKIRKKLRDVNVEKLTDKEKVIFFAYLHSTLVKYTKEESLMAVISNDIDQDEYSNELAAIIKILGKDDD